MPGAAENRRLVLKLLGLTLGMFCFGVFVLPPLYDAFCEVTGLNGKTGGKYEAVDVKVDTSRTIKVQFLATNNEQMPWEFRPMVDEVEVHPGESKLVTFYARNPTGKDMVGQAIPSMVPFNAVNYFHKMECFCFNNQPLKAGKEAELPMMFIVDQDIPKQVNTITLSYTLFDVTNMVQLAANGEENRAGRAQAGQ